MVIMIPLYIITCELNLIDTYLGLIIVYTGIQVPFTTWILKSFFQSFPTEIEEAALIDGCSYLQVLTKIIIPLSITPIASMVAFSFITSWNQFLVPLLLGGRNTMPVTTALPLFVGLFGQVELSISGMEGSLFVTRETILAVGGVISSLPTILLALIFHKYIVKGLVEGALKR